MTVFVSVIIIGIVFWSAGWFAEWWVNRRVDKIEKRNP